MRKQAELSVFLSSISLGMCCFFTYVWTSPAFRMARGQQKIQSQAKAAEKSAKLKKQQGHSANDQKKAAQKALVHVCTVCKVKIFVIHDYFVASNIYWKPQHISYDSCFFFHFLQAQMPDPKTYKQHFENKHPKNDLPDDLKNI